MYEDDLSGSNGENLHEDDGGDSSSSDYSALDHPSKPQSAYGIFFQETQETLKEVNNDFNYDEIASIVAEMWKSVDESGRQLYMKRAEEAKQKYLQELATYRVNKAAAAEPDSSDDDDDQPLSNLRNKMRLEKTTVVQSKSKKTIKALPPATITSTLSHPSQITAGNEDQKTRSHDSVQPILQTLAREMKPSSANDDAKDDHTEYQGTIVPCLVVKKPEKCRREGCTEISAENPSSWDKGYCSAKCVANRVEDLFQHFVRLKQK